MKRTMMFFALCVSVQFASAADYIVTRTDDPNPDVVTLPGCRPSGGCSLRQAVLAANARAGADRIVLSKKTYELTRTNDGQSLPDGRSGALLVTDTLEVVGGSAALTRIRWRAGLTIPHQPIPHKHQVWIVNQPVQFDISRLTLSGGRGSYGGCIFMQLGDLTLEDSAVEECTSDYAGGAIYLNGQPGNPSIVTLTNAALRNNQARLGGAIFVSRESIITANGVDVVSNVATESGGALYGIYGIGISLYPLKLEWRSEGAGTRFSGNSSGQSGGAVALIGAGTARFYAASSGIELLFENNLALAEGGALSMRRFASAGSQTRLDVEHAVFNGNRAEASGGGIALRDVDALISQSAFEGNISAAGQGGALSSEIGSAPGSVRGVVDVLRSSFNENRSQLGGGAVANQCQSYVVRDSSFYANQSVQGQGEAISATGNTSLVHVSTDGHGQASGAGPGSLHKAYHTTCGSQPFTIANSLIAGADSCYSQSGTMTSQGGNVLGPFTGNCGFSAGLDQYSSNAQIAISLGTYGGSQRVLGWNQDGNPRPQVNFGQTAFCSTLDVRGLPRPAAACDSGAFEQQ
jgi:hypothetical protein